MPDGGDLPFALWQRTRAAGWFGTRKARRAASATPHRQALQLPEGLVTAWGHARLLKFQFFLLAPPLPVPLTALPFFLERGWHCESGLQEDADKGASHGSLQGVHQGKPQRLGEQGLLWELQREGFSFRGYSTAQGSSLERKMAERNTILW